MDRLRDRAEAATEAVGDLFLVDIGVPRSTQSQRSASVSPPFAFAGLLSLIPTDDDRFRARPLQ